MRNIFFSLVVLAALVIACSPTSPTASGSSQAAKPDSTLMHKTDPNKGAIIPTER